MIAILTAALLNWSDHHHIVHAADLMAACDQQDMIGVTACQAYLEGVQETVIFARLESYNEHGIAEKDRSAPFCIPDQVRLIDEVAALRVAVSKLKGTPDQVPAAVLVTAALADAYPCGAPKP